MYIHHWIFLILLSFVLFSCGDDDEPSISPEQQIIDYLESNNLDAQKTSSGLYYVIDTPGSDEKPDINSTVVLDLIGRFTNGTQFESTYQTELPLVFDVQNFIPGFQEGIQLFGRGGKGQLIIHPDLAFGSAGNVTVPPNSVLIFAIELYDFYNDPAVYNERLISTYIEENNIVAERTQTGLYYVIDEPGEDPFPSAGSIVTVDYIGYLLDGTVFDSSIDRGTPLEIALSGVIQGWQEGIALFGTGGKGKLLIPSHLAYGRTGSAPNIGPDAPIIFDIELLKVE